MLLNDLSPQHFLLEANLLNGGNDEIVVNDANGNEVDVIHSFQKITSKFIQSVVGARTPPEVKQWFDRNFTKWLKSGAPDVGNRLGVMDEKRIQEVFYVPLTNYIEELLYDNEHLTSQGLLSEDIILASLPEYARRDVASVVVFSNGRLYRLRKIFPVIQSLHDYMVAISQNKKERNDEIMPPDFMVKRLDTLPPPEAIRRSTAWHRWVEINAEKISYEQAKQMVVNQKPGVDYKIIEKVSPNMTIVQLLSLLSADNEGNIMKHCVASYGQDIVDGTSIIYSARDKNNVPVATIELDETLKKAEQVKGPHNSTINPKYHDDLRLYFKSNKIRVGADSRNFGGMKKNETPRNKPDA